MTPRSEDAQNPELISGDWIVSFEPRKLDDIRAIVKPDPESDRRFETVWRVSEINLSIYRTLLHPFVRAMADSGLAEAQHKLDSESLHFEFFSERNPLMQQLAVAAEQVREQRQPVAPGNPFVAMQAAVSSSIVAALDGSRVVRDSIQEQIFLATYGSPLLQAMVGLNAASESPRRYPGLEPERRSRSSLVAAARRRRSRPARARLLDPLIETSMDHKHEKHQRLVGRCKDLSPVPTAVAYPCDETSLKGGSRRSRRPRWAFCDRFWSARETGSNRSRRIATSTSRATSWSTCPTVAPQQRPRSVWRVKARPGC